MLYSQVQQLNLNTRENYTLLSILLFSEINNSFAFTVKIQAFLREKGISLRSFLLFAPKVPIAAVQAKGQHENDEGDKKEKYSV